MDGYLLVHVHSHGSQLSDNVRDVAQVLVHLRLTVVVEDPTQTHMVSVISLTITGNSYTVTCIGYFFWNIMANAVQDEKKAGSPLNERPFRLRRRREVSTASSGLLLPEAKPSRGFARLWLRRWGVEFAWSKVLLIPRSLHPMRKKG